MPHPTPRLRVIRWLPFFALIVVVRSGAQSLPTPPAREEPVVLSPFLAAAETDTGYLATSSLAGTRLKTDFRDIASQVSVMTPEFLADIGAFSNNDAFTYSMNTENAAEVSSPTKMIGRANGSFTPLSTENADAL